jgi:peptidyl-prolyl cis-trans isomerase A (cyclophilin A)
MAHRKKIDDHSASKTECYYCKASIPETAMRCPNCGKFFSAAKKLAVLSVILIVVVAGTGAGFYFYMGAHQGYENGLEPEPNPNPTESNRFVNVVTSLGTIKVEMYEDTAPVTAGHFISLVQSGALSTGASFYRAEPGFVIQGGLGSNAGSAPTVAWENNGIMNTQYTISMARSDDPDDTDPTVHNTGSSEFFINLADNTQSLNTNVEFDYVVFGKVVAGFDVVSQIAALPTTDSNGIKYINNPITITSVTLSES